MNLISKYTIKPQLLKLRTLLPLLSMLFIVTGTYSQSIDTTQIVEIGGIKQFIQLKGRDRSNPLLLYLHGGPGGSVMSYANKFTSTLQKHFVVVQWDQRETGKTLSLNHSPQPLTLSLFENDTHELIELLREQFHHEKIYLAGHSWGTVLGFYIAGHYPDLLHAYIAISPVINQVQSERILLDRLKEKAINTRNQLAIEELSNVNIPFENGEQLYFDRKWMFYFNNQKVRSFTKAFAQSWADTWLNVWNEACKINLVENLRSIKCPVYFFVGRKDYQTNFNITEDYYNALVAPEKGLYWFEHSGHGVPTSEPSRMQDIILDEIIKKVE